MVAPSPSCVHGGGGGDSAGVVVAGIVLLTNFSQEARSKDGARELWCGSLALAGHLRATEPDLPEDDAAERLVPQVFRVGRDAGYSLHRVQARNLGLDAWRVMGNEEAKAAQSDTCQITP